MNNITYNDPQVAFETAIAAGRLSTDTQSAVYAGQYMYMGTQDGRDLFKHVETREYLK